MSSQTSASERAASAKETVDVLYDMSQLLNTGLDRETLVLCIQLIENGVNPEALAAVIQELRREQSILAAQASGAN